MEYFNKKMNIVDFHFSDLDPTVNEKELLKYVMTSSKED